MKLAFLEPIAQINIITPSENPLQLTSSILYKSTLGGEITILLRELPKSEKGVEPCLLKWSLPNLIEILSL